MFTQGQLIFAIFFVITFTIIITLSYKRDLIFLITQISPKVILYVKAYGHSLQFLVLVEQKGFLEEINI